MSERIDHGQEARKHIGWAHDWQEREGDTEDTILSVKAVQVDGETVKGGVFYTLRDGELVEVGE